MEQFLYWGQVQQHLRMRHEEGLEPYSFYQAVMELWEQGAYQEAEELPRVNFDSWDISDLGQLETLMDNTPVELSTFMAGFQSKVNARAAVRHTQGVRGAPIRIAEHQAMGIHAHNVFRILYVVRGQARLVTGGSGCVLPESTVCILGPDFYHDAVAEDGCIMLSVALMEDTLKDTLYRVLGEDNILSHFFRLGMGGEQSGCLLLHMRDVDQLRSIFRGILQECYTPKEYSHSIYNSYLEILFALILRNGEDFRAEHQRLHTATPMLAVLKYIQEHYRETSLDAVAELYHYSPSYLGKQIKLATGKNYTGIVRELRINEAKLLLAETDLSVDQVAAQAGFDSRVHFFRSFRAAVGMTPGEWRQQTIRE